MLALAEGKESTCKLTMGASYPKMTPFDQKIKTMLSQAMLFKIQELQKYKDRESEPAFEYACLNIKLILYAMTLFCCKICISVFSKCGFYSVIQSFWIICTHSIITVFWGHIYSWNELSQAQCQGTTQSKDCPFATLWTLTVDCKAQ